MRGKKGKIIRIKLEGKRRKKEEYETGKEGKKGK